MHSNHLTEEAFDVNIFRFGLYNIVNQMRYAIVIILLWKKNKKAPDSLIRNTFYNNIAGWNIY
jgi:hypothetical protein